MQRVWGIKRQLLDPRIPMWSFRGAKQSRSDGVGAQGRLPFQDWNRGEIKRKVYGKDRTLAERALAINPSAVGSNDGPGNGQPQSPALGFAVGAGRCPVKSFENTGHVGFGNADARIRELHADERRFDF